MNKRTRSVVSGTAKRRAVVKETVKVEFKEEVQVQEDVKVKEEVKAKEEVKVKLEISDEMEHTGEKVEGRGRDEAEGSEVVERKDGVDVKQEVPDIEDLPNVFPKIQESDLTGDIKRPERWLEIYNEVVEMRSKMMTPVDTMGSSRIPNTITPHLLKKDPHTYRFQLLISLMLSSQTKDEVVYATMKEMNELFRERGFPKGVTLESVLTLTDVELDTLIGKIGFHNKKTVYIKKSCIILQEKFKGDIPTTIEDVVSLPGVGPKMGYLLLLKGWGITTGIGVDVHLHRLSMMWGWAKESKNPENTRKQLESWFPPQFWGDINPVVVGFGQAICTPQVKNCDICSLAAKNICKSKDRKLANQPLTQKRMEKLRSNRADLSKILVEFDPI